MEVHTVCMCCVLGVKSASAPWLGCQCVLLDAVLHSASAPQVSGFSGHVTVPLAATFDFLHTRCVLQVCTGYL